MIPDNRISVHPGEILLEEYLRPLGLSQIALAQHLGVPTQRMNEIIRGKHCITPATAWLLSQAFQTTPQFWLFLQNQHDLARSRPRQKIEPFAMPV